MRIEYGVLLSGASIPIDGVGKVHSPKLKSVFESRDAYFAFCFVRSICSSDAQAIRKLITDTNMRPLFAGMTDMEFDHCSVFDLITTVPQIRNLFGGGLSMFFDDPVIFLPENKCFAFVQFGEEQETVTGIIDASNFKTVCRILRMVSSQPHDDNDEDVKFGGENAKRLWEKHNRLEEEHPVEHNEDYSLANMISKLSCGNTAYTLLTIYDLSVFQLYDQFEAYTQSRVAAIGEKAYSTWGGDDFDALSWFHINNSDSNGG